ncbi:MAG: hypothetical protein HY897_16120 [Deltaproteobacteria bacterium]|nr:hypothetical protein [Deltaproteobacteria bacterium]
MAGTQDTSRHRVSFFSRKSFAVFSAIYVVSGDGGSLVAPRRSPVVIVLCLAFYLCAFGCACSGGTGEGQPDSGVFQDARPETTDGASGVPDGAERDAGADGDSGLPPDVDVSGDDGERDGGEPDSGPEDTGAGFDGGETDAGAADTGWVDPRLICQKLGLPSAEFSPGPYGTARREVAGDFTLPTFEGDWNFGSRFSGCETYLFIPEETPMTRGFPTPWWTQDFEMLIWNSPRNVHYFFVATADISSVQQMKTRLHAFLDLLDPAERDWWKGRVHFVSKTASALGNWVGSYAGSPGLGFGVDRFQRIRDFGSPSDPMRYNESAQWFEPNLSYVAHEAKYYEFEWARGQRLATENPTVVRLFDKENVQGVVERDVPFPDAASMAGFDTIELDLTANCPAAGSEPAACGEWDYVQALHLCDTADPSKCDVEIGRWITSYAREGRWLTDASQALAFLEGGGTRRLRFDASGQKYAVTLELRLSNRGKGMRPGGAVFLFSGGAFDATYNDKYQPATVAVPADAKRVEIFAVITGHGFGVEKENCAEFCAHEHHFDVNGTKYVKTNPDAGSYTGCAENVPNGVVPNQYGTWFFGRGGWCPGYNVSPWVADVTSSAVVGGDNVITYRGLLYGAPYVPEPSGGTSGFPANVNMTSYLVFWK